MRQAAVDSLGCVCCDSIQGGIISTDEDNDLLRQYCEKLMAVHECDLETEFECHMCLENSMIVAGLVHDKVTALANLIRGVIEYRRTTLGKHDKRLRTLYFNIAECIRE